jgi:hypothetical protein
VITASFGTGRPEHVAFWRPSNNSLERVGGWRMPGGSAPDGLVDVRFVELSRAVTVNESGQVVIWNVRDGSAIAGCRVTAGVGRAFSPDGAKLAGLGVGELFVWDLTTGKLLHDIALQGEDQPSCVDWIDDRFVLANDRDLVDIEVGLGYWGVSKDIHVKAIAIVPAGNSCYLFQDDQQAESLFSFTLPLDQIENSWKQVSRGKMVTLEPGPVSLEIEGLPFSASEQARIRSSLTRQLQERLRDRTRRRRNSIVEAIQGLSIHRSVISPGERNRPAGHHSAFPAKGQFLLRDSGAQAGPSDVPRAW